MPPLGPDGKLPPGIHVAEWDDFVARFGIGSHRTRLVEGLYRAAVSLRNAGSEALYIGGSLVTTAEQPGDFDGCWDPVGVDPEKLDPVLLDFTGGRRAQKVKYGGELFPSSFRAELQPPFRTFLEFFQSDKTTGLPKGVVAIDLRRLP